MDCSERLFHRAVWRFGELLAHGGFSMIAKNTNFQRKSRQQKLPPRPLGSSFVCDLSASCNCRSENVCILPVIVAELELGNIERHNRLHRTKSRSPCRRSLPR